jgi:flavodoxin
MKSVIVYWSRYGNGEKIVNHLSNKLKEEKVETKIFKTNEANPSKLPIADIYIFSSPTEAFNIQKNMRDFIKNLEGMDGKMYGIINTHAMKKDRLYKMDRLLSKKNMIKVTEIDFQVGKNANTGNGLADGWEIKVDNFVKQLL